MLVLPPRLEDYKVRYIHREIVQTNRQLYSIIGGADMLDDAYPDQAYNIYDLLNFSFHVAKIDSSGPDFIITKDGEYEDKLKKLVSKGQFLRVVGINILPQTKLINIECVDVEDATSDVKYSMLSSAGSLYIDKQFDALKLFGLTDVERKLKEKLSNN